MSTSPRALMPDYLRLIALFGIVVVNVGYMGFSLFGDPSEASTGRLDEVVLVLVNGLAATKFYGLFSFMFGVGLAYQMASAERRALPFGPLYRNRMIGLLGLGLLHGCLFFPGDILVLYALIGSLLFFLRHWAVGRLVRLGAGLVMVQAVVSAVLVLQPMPGGEFAQIEAEIMTSGTALEVTALRSISFAGALPFLLLFQGIAALGWFCLGLAAVRSGLIERSNHPLWQRARRIGLWPGIGLSLIAAALTMWGPRPEAEAVLMLLGPLTTIGYLGAIAAIARPPRRAWAGAMLQAGGSSLSIYLGQSIVLCTLFAPYGLALWGVLSPTAAIGMALFVTVMLIALLVLWRRAFALGPFEWLLRRITGMGVRSA